MKDEVLYIENLTTDQSAGKNLEYVSLTLNAGEILGVTGVGDSGTSALADALVGRLRPSGGRIYLHGKHAAYHTKGKARELGIFEITYDAAIVSDISVSENLNVLREFSWRNFVIRKKANRETTQAIFAQYGISGLPEGKAGRMTVGQQMEVSICRALLGGAKVLVLREVGEGFSNEELAEFARFLHQIRDEGVSMIVFNSDVRKALLYADRVAVMRSGMVCWLCEATRVTADDIYRRMRLPARAPAARCASEPPQLYAALQGVCLQENDAYTFSADLYTGQALGVLCESSARMDVFYRMFSGAAPALGNVVCEQRIESFTGWRSRHAHEIYCLKTRFWEKGLHENLTAAENIVLRSMYRFGDRLGIMNKRMLRLALHDFAVEHGFEPDALQAYPRHLPVRLRNQLVLLGMLFTPTRLLVLDHPFYTIDEQIKEDLLRCIAELKRNGTAILWSSNDRSVLQAYCEHSAVYLQTSGG